MYSGEVGEGRGYTLFSRRNSSLSPAGRILVFGSLAVVTVAISLGFAMHGAWPVVPFAGLECLGLYIAYLWLRRHQNDYQRISVDGDRILVETREGDVIRRSEFNHAWARVVVEDRADGRSSVFICSHGRTVEIAKWLTDEGRIETARRLKRQISEQQSRIPNLSGEV